MNATPAVPGSPPAATRVLLGWDAAGWRAQQSSVQPAPSSCLDAAAAWLLQERGRDLGRLVVALPGARAGRRLLECLVGRAGAATGGRAGTAGARGTSDTAFVPPTITTVGHLTDRLLELDRPPAGRLARTLVWSAAVRAADGATLAPLVPRPPAADDHAGWWALAEELRTLHGEIAAEGLDFEAVRAVVAAHEGEGTEGRRPGRGSGRGAGRETARWSALVALQRAYRERLAALGLGDPHALRREALDAGRLSDRPPVVLVGVVELSGLQRRLIERLGADVAALVFAPPARDGDFDALGCVRPERWIDAPIELADERLHVVGRPDDQARAARDALAAQGGRYAADAITIGVPDDDVVPWVEHRLQREGVATRRAAGTPVADTAVARLLASAVALIARRRVGDLAAFVRHPLVSAWLARRAAEDGREAPDAPALLDAYHARHLPDRLPEPPAGRWLGREEWREERAARDALTTLHADVRALLGDLCGGEVRPLPGWVGPIRALLLRVHGEPLDRASRAGHEAASALESLDAALTECSGLPAALAHAAPLDAAAALHLLLRATAGRSVPPRRDAGAVELLGWLELALDDAPALVLTGMNEGRVPEPVRGVAALPDAVRRELRLPDDGQRHARDAWALSVMCHAREALAVIAGRRGLDDEPLLPSRLLFHAGPGRVVARVQRVLAEQPAAEPEPEHDASGAVICADGPPPAPRSAADAARGAVAGAGADVAADVTAPASVRRVAMGPLPPLDAISVTGFRTWIRSPYLFYLQRVLDLKQADDAARELDALEFGILAHEVLASFGKDARVRDSTDAEVIRKALDTVLERHVAGRFGRRPLPAVLLQVEQLRRRLTAFASWQAARAAEGWRIKECEWAPTEPVVLDAGSGPVTLRGRIDRMDVHVDGRRWALLDYKTSNEPSKPEREHGPRDGAWHDLQLPLYELLARSFAAERAFEQPPELGYVVLPRDVSKTGILPAPWSPEVVEEAHEEARRLVDAMRTQGLQRLGDFPERDPLLASLAGVGLLAEPDEDEDEGAGGNGADGAGAADAVGKGRS